MALSSLPRTEETYMGPDPLPMFTIRPLVSSSSGMKCSQTRLGPYKLVLRISPCPVLRPIPALLTMAPNFCWALSPASVAAKVAAAAATDASSVVSIFRKSTEPLHPGVFPMASSIFETASIPFS
eukprot:CAMPEP_0168192288 /NCGR_PEP_ID=MMETSP0139_2-20121125/17967_1 /TAXON_ID=44445 /ORGANISM="Pseudo-nitzschia australis, Strain 10249 10 AB" /LENGTH=124 /DNA_ID=CAMNT_0008115515 /DNA_START=806 /DNA_END=1180 /DNA_ORIENTATION=-